MTFIPNPSNGIQSTLNTTTESLGCNNLNGAIDAVQQTILLNNTSTFSNTGVVIIDNEIILYSSIATNTLIGCTRGYSNTVATTHLNNIIVKGIFIGISEFNNLPDLMISCKSSHAGLLFCEFSVDNINWDLYPQNGFIITPNQHEYRNSVKGPRYFRCRFSNTESTPLTFLRIFTYFGVFRQGLLSLNQTISDDADSTISRSINTAKNPSNIFVNQRADGYIVNTINLLGANASHISPIFETDGFSQIQAELFSLQNGTLYGYWYSDNLGTNIIRSFIRPYIASENYIFISGPIFGPFFKSVYINDSVAHTDFYLGIRLLTKSISGNIVGLTDTIPKNLVANLGRNIIVGQTDGGVFKNVPITNNGHIEVAIHAPVLPFGAVHSEHLDAMIQLNAVYGINVHNMRTVQLNGGLVLASNSMFIVSTGTTVNAIATLQSTSRILYKAGQGIVAIYSGIFSPRVNNNYQIIGIGHAEDGVYFGYKHMDVIAPYNEFGILYAHHGKCKMVELAIFTSATIGGIATIILNGISFTVPLTATTSIARTVYEITLGTYTRWKVQTYSESSVIFVADYADNIYNTPMNNNSGYNYIVGTTGSTGTFLNIRNGLKTTEQFIPQSAWNGDILNGLGGILNPSGILLDPTKGNVFKIGLQYLGFGAITFEIEIAPLGNTPTIITVHTLRLPNTLTQTSFSNPCFQFTQSVISVGSITNISIKSGSFGGFIAGAIKHLGNRFVYAKTINSITVQPPNIYQCIYTIQNKLYFGLMTNYSLIYIVSIGVVARDTGSNSAGTVVLIKNGILTGNPQFISYSQKSVSNTDILVSATNVSITDNSQILFSFPVAGNTSQTFTLATEIILQPGEQLTVACSAIGSTLSNLHVVINTREEN